MVLSRLHILASSRPALMLILFSVCAFLLCCYYYILCYYYVVKLSEYIIRVCLLRTKRRSTKGSGTKSIQRLLRRIWRVTKNSADLQGRPMESCQNGRRRVVIRVSGGEQLLQSAKTISCQTLSKLLTHSRQTGGCCQGS